ncbi:transcription factor EAT1-like [Magnolia sinica]|uniref:transcription factor EAT1-like n=1 Tax=Magnolia sinica TaxID=86752 RepID=UPI002658ECB3|nr:transcription factor EAT1-like [Magnolia sinica]
MYGECDYIDSHDRHLLQGPVVDGPPQTTTNFPSLAAMASSNNSNNNDNNNNSSNNNNSLEDNLRLSSFSLEDISRINPSEEAVTIGIDLQQQLGFDLEQEYNSHLKQEMLEESHPPLDHPSWESGHIHEMQDTSIHHHLHQQQHQFQLQQHEQQNLQHISSAPFTNSPYGPPDLLNLLHLPRCSVPPVLPTSSISFDGGPARRTTNNFHTSLGFLGELPTADSTTASTVLYDPPLQLNFPPQPPMFQDLFYTLPHSYELPGSMGGSYFGGADDREGNGGVFQEGDGRQFETSVLDFRREIPGLCKGEVRGTNTEKQRREQSNEKYQALRSLVPNPTKNDRATIVADAIDYIKELLRTVDELKILVDKKRCGWERSKKCKMDDEAAPADMESSSMKPLTNREQSFNGSLRSSWLLRKSKDTIVDVRIIDDEVNIKLTQRKKMNCLLLVGKIIDELQMELLQVAGGNIGDYYIFMFNTKISEGSSVYASAIAKKLIDVLDRQHPAFPASF